MNNNEYLVGVYKEVGKTPDIIKIKNQKEYPSYDIISKEGSEIDN